MTLRFAEGPHGKPGLIGAKLEYNISHGGRWVCMAVNSTQPVGVDVEQDQTAGCWGQVLNQITTKADCAARPLEHWTAKEALLKALGTGFLKDPRDIILQRSDTGFAAVLGNVELIGAWQAPDADHLLAVAGVSGDFAWHIAGNSVDLRHVLDTVF